MRLDSINMSDQLDPRFQKIWREILRENPATQKNEKGQPRFRLLVSTLLVVTIWALAYTFYG